MVIANIPLFLTARTINGDKVINMAGEHMGKIEDLMIDLENGRVAYAVLSFGGFLGLGNKLFAVPWEALPVRPHEHVFTLNVSKEILEKAETKEEVEEAEVEPIHPSENRGGKKRGLLDTCK
jgi:hypothetical protein